MDDSRFASALEYTALARDLVALVVPALTAASRTHGIVVGVAGESGSGKTVTAVSLARELEASGVRTGIIHQDDYFLRAPRANHAHRLVHLDDVGPQEVNLPLLALHIAAFRQRRQSVPVPVVEYATDCFLDRRRDFSDLSILVVEGTYALRLDDLDLRIFLEATHEDSRARRAARARDIDDSFVERVLRIEHEIVAAQVAVAHIVIDRQFTIRELPGGAGHRPTVV